MTNAFQQLSESMADAVQTLTSSLVRVDARRRMPATGIVYAPDVIVTASHVVEFEDNITIVTADGNSHTAQLVGRDPQNDLAVLRVAGASLSPAKLSEGVRVGQLMLAVGKPHHNAQVALGAVSSIVPPLRERGEGKRKRGRRGWGQALVDGFVRVDVVMYPGFSGGALLGGDGAVYGLMTSGFGGDSAIAVPVTTIKNTVETLLKHGKMKQGYLGVGVQAVRLPAAVAEKHEQETGLLVISVEAKSPAEESGFMIGDILLSIDDDAVSTVDELLMSLHGERIGKSVPIAIVRGGLEQSIAVTIGERE